MLKIYSKEEAKRTILKRLPLEQYPILKGVKEKIREVFGSELSPSEVVARIIEEVRTRGDDALKDFTRKFDGIEISQFEVSQQEIKQALNEVPRKLVLALKIAKRRIEDFHKTLKPKKVMEFSKGIGWSIRPLERVGIYVPGGRACYPSTVLMASIPARIAGVKEIILTTPPREDGKIPSPTLASCYIAGIDRIFKVGGAQAIAALAFGSGSIPKVDKICGPGNIFVQLAKKQVYGITDIDGIYGPTEVMLLADRYADVRLCASELLAQAEHDIMASAILITDAPEVARGVCQEIKKQLKYLKRKEIISEALSQRGGIILLPDLREGWELINDYAPEHLLLMIKDAQFSQMDLVRNAGAVSFCSPIALTDYVVGPSHILPTGGTACFRSPLGVRDFLKVINIIALDEKERRRLSRPAITLARAEGLTAHARSVEIWNERKGSWLSS